jgi:hypothetical protein
MADSQLENGSSTIDIDAASARIGESLFGSSTEPEAPEATESIEQPSVTPSPQPLKTAQSVPPEQAASDLLPAPKSWKQDMHPYWAKMPKEAQQYYNEREQQMLTGMQQFKQIQSVIAPFEPQLSQRGITAYDWIRGLANAEVMLTSGTDEQRRAAYKQLGDQLGFTQSDQNGSQPQVDPVIKQLQERQEAIERGLKAQHEAVIHEARTKVQSEIEAFAADKAHPYFDEVADEIATFVRSGLSLQDAYDRAVWANPSTRAKEQARTLTEHEAKLKENARLTALPKRKATSVNVRSADRSTAPTEPVGSMEDTIKAKLREIRTRAS